MISNKYSTLISKLLSSTKENRTHWQKTGRQNEYSTELSQFMITLSMVSSGTFSIGKERNSSYVLSVINDEGENIDICEILSSDPSIVMTSELFAEARRSYYQVDEVLDSLIDSL